jgi:NADPH-dependent ferric siderophore reductase
MTSNLKMALVSKISDISPHMRSIVFYSNDFDGWPHNLESAHVKIIVPKPGNTQPATGWLDIKKNMRSYTVRRFDSEKKLLTIEFAINEHVGVVTNWAKETNIGDSVGFMGPGSVKHKDFNADWHLIVADFTGLPAAVATIEKLPKIAQGYAVIQVPDKQDIQSVSTPAELEIEWIVNPTPREPMIYQRVAAYKWKNGEPAIFIATEVNQMKQLKALVKNRPGYNNKNVYASGYWKAEA